MTGHHYRNRFILLLGALFITACVVTAEPEWVATYLHKPDTGTTQVTWLNDMALDSSGNIVVTGTGNNSDITDGLVRTQDALIVTFSPQGERLSTIALDLADGQYRSDDSGRLVALDPQDNTYMVVHTYAVIDDIGKTSSWLVSHDSQGALRWKQQISDTDDMRGLAWHQGRVYTTGGQTLAHDANGEETLRLEHPDATRRNIDFADNGDLVVAGSGSVSRYTSSGELLWTHVTDQDLINNGSVLVAQSGDVVVAEGTQDDRGGANITRIDSQGNTVWSRNFKHSRRSYGAAGPALVMEDYRGDLYLVLSNSDRRRMVKLDASGSTYWNETNSNGIVQDAGLVDGGLFIVGNAYDEKLDARNGDQVAEARIGRGIQNTQGSLLVDGDRIYTGYAAQNDDNRFAMFVSRYKDQPIN